MDLEAQWITGFVDGEGCFYIGINKHDEMTSGYQILPEFTVVQHKRDVQILYALKSYFQCGVVRTIHGDSMAFRVRSIKHLTERIIPFFEKHKLKTKKQQDFISFRKVLLKINRKEHLTSEGIEEINQIASKMNTGKVFSTLRKIESDCIGNYVDNK